MSLSEARTRLSFNPCLLTVFNFNRNAKNDFVNANKMLFECETRF